MIKYILISIVAVFTWSCDDYLERYPLAEIAPENFFKTADELKLYTNSFYGMIPSASGIYGESVDNIITSSLSEEVRGTRIVPSSGGGWSWGDLRNINFFLENSYKCSDDNARKQYNGVARFFRAWFYFQKVQRFGDVPWYSGTIPTDDEESLQRARDPRMLVMDSVLADIDYAIASLPTVKNAESVTKWTALALKTRICLFEGTFRKYHSEFTLPDADRFLDECIEAADELMNSKVYSIYKSSPDKAYLQLFSSVNAIESEVILTRRFLADQQVYHNVNFYLLSSTQGQPGVEKKTVNSYLMNDGRRFTDTPGYESRQYYEEMQNRDPRLTQTVRGPGYMRIGETKKLVPDFAATVTGYHLIKYVAEPIYDSYEKSVNDLPVFRYAEVLLNYAEAKAERGTLGQSDLDKSIKLLRDRVGMPNLDMAAVNTDPCSYMAGMYTLVTGANKGVILEIRRERTVELIMESFRWNDLMRWKEGHLLAEPFKGMYFPGTGSYDLDNDGITDVVIYTGTKPGTKGPQYMKLNSDVVLENGESGGVILVNSQIPKVFDENKDYLYPIPIEERLLNHQLSQNPGWDDGLDF